MNTESVRGCPGPAPNETGGNDVKKRRSRWTALAAAFVLLGLSVRTDTAYGAVGIDTGREDCAVHFELGKETYAGPEGGQVDYKTLALESLEIPVKLYQVASVNVSGKYTAAEHYKSLTEKLASVNSQTAAGTWAELAKSAQELAEPGADQTAVKGDKPVKEITLEHAKGTADGLGTGLYLVSAQEVQTPEYIYSFQPYLVSLPGNAYNPSKPSGPDNKDDWLYEVTVGLKPSRANRYGDLEIQKTLNTYNATLGGATFIFQVEAEKDGIIYSDVFSIVFDRAGTRSVKTGKIPAGADVKVTEVYTGASYELKTDAEQTRTILADETVSAAFTNDYDERLSGGTSIVNHFKAKGDGSLADENAGRTGTPDVDDAGQNLDDTQNTRSRILWDVEQLSDSTGQTGGSSDEENVE